MTRAAPLPPGPAPDLAARMGPDGASGVCWCMLWRLRARDWAAGFREMVRRELGEGWG